jgi:hypothetical protein
MGSFAGETNVQQVRESAGRLKIPKLKLEQILKGNFNNGLSSP